MVIWQATDSDCGPACVTWLLKHWGIKNIRLDDITAALHTNAFDGTDPRTIEAYLRSWGLKVLAGEMEVSDLKQSRPVLLTLRNHYSVAVACQRNRVTLMDPSEGEVKVSISELMERWSDVDRLGAVYNRWGLAVWK